ncbi:EamA family transporter [Desulfonatronum parangueonense]
MDILLALLAAVAFGAADFSAGLASRRSPALTVTFLSQLTGLVMFGVVLGLIREQPTVLAVGWGSVAGAVVALSIFAYYRALAMGNMGIVATITAIWSAVVPFALGLALGERPTWMAVWGIFCVIIAVGIMSHVPKRALAPAGTNPGGRSQVTALVIAGRLGEILKTPGLLGATLAGIGFGLLGIFMKQASMHGNIMWPVFAASIAAVATTGVVLAATRSLLIFQRQNLPHIVSAGVLQSLGVLFFLLAIQDSLVSIIAVVVALSPAPTMFLARVFFKENMTRAQVVGVVIALWGIVLITVHQP